MSTGIMIVDVIAPLVPLYAWTLWFVMREREESRRLRKLLGIPEPVKAAKPSPLPVCRVVRR